MVKMPDLNYRQETSGNLSTEELPGSMILRHHPMFKSIFENAMAGLVLASLEGEIIEANNSFCRMVGYDSEEIVGLTIQQLTHHEDWPSSREILQRLQDQQDQWGTCEKRFIGKKGDIRWGKVTSSCLSDAAGRTICRIAMIQDIHDLKLAEIELRQSENFWITVFDNLTDPVYIVDVASNRVCWANMAFQRDSGLSLEQIREKSCHEISYPCLDSQRSFSASCPLRKVIASGEPTTAEHQSIGADGKDRFHELSLSPIHGEDGQVEKIVFVSRDITRRHRAEIEVRQLASFDVLTGLANRSMLHEQLTREMTAADRKDSMVGLFILDLDRFKKINDTLGHQVGDQLLRTLAERLRQTVRKSDIVARLGGDEFAIIAPDIKNTSDACRMAGKMLATFHEPFLLTDLEVFITPSIGIALYPGDGDCPSSLIKNADMAMYQAKEKGGNTYCYYSSELNRHTHKRLKLESDLRNAISKEQLFLVYQPQIDLAVGRMTGVEALVRWNHPEHGLIPPGQFIPMAEESGYIFQLSEWILRTACRQAGLWRKKGLPSLQMAVNLSGYQFRDPNLPDLVAEVLHSTDLPANALELELTETILMDTGPSTLKILKKLKRLGVHLAIDDFGTGYSSLLYLKNFAMDRIKIAREFVSDMEEEGNRAIVETMVAMGRTLGMEVIAEGVERAQELKSLLNCGCSQVQGFYFARPLHHLDMENFLTESNDALPYGLK